MVGLTYGARSMHRRHGLVDKFVEKVGFKPAKRGVINDESGNDERMKCTYETRIN